nr:hypothetical protein [Actinomycetes bacterium]
MWTPASPSGKRSKGIRIPVMPAWVNSSAHSDHSQAAVTPTEIKVSMVAAPWRALVTAARWKGQAPQTTTGEARVREIHCQLSNCSAGIIDRASTGTVNAAETTRRCRQSAASRSRTSGSGRAAPSSPLGACVGTVAV